MLKHLIVIAGLLAAPMAALATDTPAPVATQAAQAAQVNINTANAEQMASALTGVGLSKAKAIVDYREQHGPFTNLAHLTRVKGIGPKILEQNDGRLQL